MAKWGSCDFKELLQLQQRMERAEQEIQQIYISTLKEIAQEFLNEVISRTPTSNTNDLKNDWVCDFNVVQNGDTYEITIKNENEIASFIEYGHKTENNGWKEGHFMLHITEQQIHQRLDKLTRQKVENYLKGVF